MRAQAEIPLRWVGPIRVSGPVIEEELQVPLATFETPLWPSVGRGAKVSMQCAGGIAVTVVDERMSRSVLLEAPNAQAAVEALKAIHGRRDEIALQIRGKSRFTEFKDLHSQLIGNLIFLRLEVGTGDAAGHNMATVAAERLLGWILESYPSLRYVSISANFCTDKKVSAVNGILGRGRSTIAEMLIPETLCQDLLRTSPSALVDLHIKKNLLGSIAAGGLRTANAHVANVLLGFYLATGQDAANLVEGSQAIVHTELRAGALYFSVTLPHLIVGTVGNGKELPFVRENLERLGCLADRPTGENARRLAAIIAAAVCCGELSLLAAQTNRGELTRAHELLERR